MDYKIRVKRYRPLQRGGQKRVIHCRFGSDGLGARGNGADIDDAHERIAGCLDQDQRRLLFKRRRQRLVALINKGYIELASVASGADQSIGASIAIMGSNHELIRFQLCQYEINCGHSRRQHDGADATFKFGDRVSEQVSEQVPARIRSPCVLVTSRLLETRKSKGARLAHTVIGIGPFEIWARATLIKEELS